MKTIKVGLITNVLTDRINIELIDCILIPHTDNFILIKILFKKCDIIMINADIKNRAHIVHLADKSGAIVLVYDHHKRGKLTLSGCIKLVEDKYYCLAQ